jgi:hypothetical protein
MIEKKCPVCFASLDIDLMRCPRCGWDFPPASGEVVVEAARWLLGRIAEARRIWLARKSRGLDGEGGGAACASFLTVSRAPAGGPAEAGPGPDRPAPTVCPDLRLVRSGPGLAVDSIGIQYVPVEPGAFDMGAPEPEGKDYERPAHRVRIARPFALARYPVTQEQWERVMGYNPGFFKDPLRPVESVTWEEACHFIRKLNRSEGADRHRLPTEAEWEYAARAGDSEAAAPLERAAWFTENSGGESRPVGLKSPNAWGLHDMLGNVWEWVNDWYGDYPEEDQDDPLGPVEGTDRVIRGGAWGSSRWNCRVYNRSVKGPGERSPLIGLRLVLDDATASRGRFSVYCGWSR